MFTDKELNIKLLVLHEVQPLAIDFVRTDVTRCQTLFSLIITVQIFKTLGSDETFCNLAID